MAHRAKAEALRYKVVKPVLSLGRALQRSRASADKGIMIWLFERGDRVARLVTRLDPMSGDYLLELEWSDGLASTERFSDLSEFQSRILALEQKLVAEEWKPAGDSPQLITADWWKP